MKRIFLVQLCLFQCLSTLFGQVNLQTGAAQFNLPLYSFSDAKSRISTSISLSYTGGSGIKVAEMASATGTGWEMEAGGYIQRIQHGEPDDQKQYDTYAYPESYNNINWYTFNQYINKYYPNGFLYARPEYTATEPVDDGGSYTPLFSDKRNFKQHPKYLEDREQDEFFFSFAGRKGIFVIGKKGADGKFPVRTLEDSKLLIDFTEQDMRNQDIRTQISSFSITDESGIVYTFRDKQLDKVVLYDYMVAGNGTGAIRIGRTDHESPYKNVVSKWCLSEIRNPLTGVAISFEYEPYQFRIEGEEKTAYVTYKKNNMTSKELSITRELKEGTAQRLKRIVCSTRESVDFVYASENRKDLPFDKALKEVAVIYEQQKKFSWKLSHSYFVKNSIKDENASFGSEELVWSRLCLTKLARQGLNNASEEPYVFTYFLGNEADNPNTGVPPMFSYLQDRWGYYNPMIYGYFNPQDYSTSTSNPMYEPYGTITGDYYYYEKPYTDINDGHHKRPAGLACRNGVLKTITNPLGGQATFEYELNSTEAWDNIGGVRVKRYTESDGINAANNRVAEYKYEKTYQGYIYPSGWGEEEPIWRKTIPVGTNTDCREGYPGIKHLQMAKWVLSSWNQIIEDVILRILNVNGIYSYTDVTTHFYTPLNFINKLPLQYSRVEVVQKLGAEANGKSIYEFTSPADKALDARYAIDIPQAISPFSAKQRYAYWIYGKPKKITLEDNQGRVVKIIEHEYDPIKERLSEAAYVNFVSQRWSADKLTYNCKISPIYVIYTNAIAWDKYTPLCGRMELKKSSESVLTSNGTYAVNVTEYIYSPLNYQVREVRTKNSKGETVDLATYYAQDYSTAGFDQQMRNGNLINLPIGTYRYITRNGVKYVVSGSVSEYGTAGNGDLKVMKTHTFHSSVPVESSLVGATAHSIPSPAYFKVLQTINYNSAGAPSEVIQDWGSEAQLYDYDQQLAVAAVVGASAANVAYTSFEGGGSGNWNYDQQYVNVDFSPTGRKHYRFSATGSSISSKTLDQSKTYILSFWAKSYSTSRALPYILRSEPVYPFYSTKNVSQVKIFSNTATGWTYYEYEITQPASVLLSNYHNPNGYLDNDRPPFVVDELRLYPKGALMTTTTFDPLIGKTTESDPNGRVIYYQYDNFGRLKTIWDENRNVVKAYEYHTKTTYYSRAVSRTFTRECPSGYSGTEVTYYVPDRKHQSDISQLDADLKAENDLRDNGQNYANDPANGGQCIPPTVYAAISYENTFSSGTDYYGDVVVRFYSDQGLTQPISVNNYTFSYVKEDPCGSGWQSYTITASGDTYAIAYSTLLEYANWTYDPWWGWYETTCYIDYYL